MRRIIKDKVRPVTIGSHPSLYAKIEELRKLYQDQAGIKLSQIQATNILSRDIKIPNKIDILGGNNVKKNNKKRRPY